MTRARILIAVSAVLLLAAPVRAGSTFQDAYCSKNADGSGLCYGTFRGFRASTDPTASANFQQTSAGDLGFQANWHGSPNVCVAARTSSVGAMWPVAMASSGWFAITWNSLGQCTYLTIGTGS